MGIFLRRYFKYGALLIIGLVLLVFFISECSSRKATPAQSRKTLKAFDYELMQIAKQFGNTHVFEALMLARRLPGIQLPFLAVNDTVEGTDLEIFNLQRARGVFYYRSIDSLPEMIAQSDSLILLFPAENDRPTEDFRIVVSSFNEVLTELGMLFPETFDALIYKGDRLVGNLSYSATFKHGMPATALLNLKAGNFDIDIQLETTFRRKKSSVAISFAVHEAGSQKVKVSIDSDVAKSESGAMAYDGKRIEIEIFPVKAVIKSDYQFSQSDAVVFFSDFNKLSDIRLTDSESNLLGNVKLEQARGRSRVNLMMYYNDGSSENLEDFLLTINKILNMKTTMPR
ncbi:MAG: hypothetical protein CVT94_15145 [Bacteroidetes bacterium HGW-Bacteroidetes-11]|jgi:hypothetical protein|nr:MAG: hypothetical protein CVT94_15145 [Bacteroidetes bacterium HGW-Bacteroidetes-11]